ncbi:ferredoxin-thioredoxin reductase catalytic domain-containing protein [Spirochaeta cellobiosiphila]|uniref:ferredoxin-thioredoxin reductase catalytic domain-containing protein n=1 Tax=Spirochaeta cellobiosiphila TaxID=504483 RepID=UPI00048AC278|nr:ferredoxin-thioredoxin reductase catalytic domain-containing protein [Spirochaeta cellobiosiphila]
MTKEQLHNYLQKQANLNNWIINWNSEFTSTIIDGLFVNYSRYNCLLCPCRESHEQKGTDHDILCPCHYAKDDIIEYQQCYCGLFLHPNSEDFSQEPQSIPDRRDDSLYL